MLFRGVLLADRLTQLTRQLNTQRIRAFDVDQSTTRTSRSRSYHMPTQRWLGNSRPRPVGCDAGLHNACQLSVTNDRTSYHTPNHVSHLYPRMSRVSRRSPRPGLSWMIIYSSKTQNIVLKSFIKANIYPTSMPHPSISSQILQTLENLYHNARHHFPITPGHSSGCWDGVCKVSRLPDVLDGEARAV